MGSNRLARQSFGMLKTCKDRILFELCLWEKKEEIRKKEEGRKKKEDEQDRYFQVWFFQACERLVEVLK